MAGYLKTINDRLSELERRLEALESTGKKAPPRDPNLPRDESIWRDHIAGLGLAAIAERHGLTKERIRQIVKARETKGEAVNA